MSLVVHNHSFIYNRHRIISVTENVIKQTHSVVILYGAGWSPNGDEEKNVKSLYEVGFQSFSLGVVLFAYEVSTRNT